jgi:hypothetical protein
VIPEGWAPELLGPQGRFVEAILDRARKFTYVDGTALAAAWDATRVQDDRVDARNAAWNAAWNAGRRDAALDAAAHAAYDPAYHAGVAADTWWALWFDAWGAAWASAQAVACRDLIGGQGFGQGQYDTLTGPWRRVIGPVHPGDVDIRAAGTDPDGVVEVSLR